MYLEDYDHYIPFVILISFIVVTLGYMYFYLSHSSTKMKSEDRYLELMQRKVRTEMDPFFGEESDQIKRIEEKHPEFKDCEERIHCVAIKDDFGKIWTVEQPGGHNHVFFYMAEFNMNKATKIRNQGFLTTHGRFLRRREALVIAIAQKQIIHKHPSPEELYSEDMWDPRYFLEEEQV